MRTAFSEIGPIGCPETSLKYYDCSLRNIPEERSFQVRSYCEREPSRRRLKVVSMQNLTFENFLFQQGYHLGDWLSRVKGKKGVVEASFLACLLLRVIALVF
jgi:hypothetical protein